MLTRTIVQVGHDLGIEIVAEGIERPEQLELLRAMGCGLGQGYLVARPMAAGAIESMAPDSMTARLAARDGDAGEMPSVVRLDSVGRSGPNEAKRACGCRSTTRSDAPG